MAGRRTRHRKTTVKGLVVGVILTATLVVGAPGAIANSDDRDPGLVGAMSPLAGAQRGDLDPEVVEQIAALTAEKASRSPAQTKIDSSLLYEIKLGRDDPLFDEVPDLRTNVLVDRDDKVLVDIDATVDDAVLNRIAVLGGVVVNSHPRYRAIRARLPLDAIERLATSASVSHIRTADQPVTRKDDTSEGDVAHRADSARGTLGVTGAGVDACVVSDSVDALAALQSSGDLPAVSVLPGQSGNPGTSEGTAMLEIVYDLAPGADLGFATASGGPAQFAQNILDLRASGCDIIVDDVGYVTSPVFQDGIIADAVDTVVADGALYFSAAGNSGNFNDGTSGVWEGDFDLLSADIHDFGDGTGLNTMTANTSLITLQWADPQGGSDNDYDLYVLNAAGDTVLGVSDDVQNGDDDPYEVLLASGNTTGDNLLVTLFSGSPRFLHLNTWEGQLDQATGGDIFGQPAAEGAFSVAAVDQATAGGGAFTGGPANPVETFSSDGFRRVFFDAAGTPYTPGDFSSTGGVVRQKPDITAADNVSTATPGFNPFPGTSAAAPHAAAIAALMLEADPTLTKTRVDSLFAATALDIEAPGVDRDSGYGIIDAFALVNAAPDPLPDVVTVTPGRVLDTRATGRTVDGQFVGGGKIRAGRFTKVQVAGRAGVASDAVGVEVNITAIQNEGRGFATLYPCSSQPPTASSLNYTPGVNIANATTVALNSNGEVCVFTSSTAHYALDVLAYVPAGSDVVTVTPGRVLDTRATGRTVDGQFVGGGKIRAGRFTKVQVAGRAGVASDAVGVEVNITAIQNEGRGFATLYPCSSQPPTASSLNYTPGVNIANATTVALNSSFGLAHTISPVAGLRTCRFGVAALFCTTIFIKPGTVNWPGPFTAFSTSAVMASKTAATCFLFRSVASAMALNSSVLVGGFGPGVFSVISCSPPCVLVNG